MSDTSATENRLNEEDVDDEFDSVTTETKVRWKWLGSIIAFSTMVGFTVLMAAAATGHANLSAINSEWYYLISITILTTLGWLYGTDIVNEYRK